MPVLTHGTSYLLDISIEEPLDTWNSLCPKATLVPFSSPHLLYVHQSSPLRTFLSQLMATLSFQLPRPYILESSLAPLYFWHPQSNLSTNTYYMFLNMLSVSSDKNVSFMKAGTLSVVFCTAMYPNYLENTAWHMVGTQYLLNKLVRI